MRLLAIFIVSLTACMAIGAPATKPAKMKWALADSAPPVLQIVLDEQPIIRPKFINTIREKIGITESLLNTVRDLDPKEKAEAVRKINERIERYRQIIRDIENDLEIVVSDVPPISVGMAGKVMVFDVVQVMDDQNALIKIVWVNDVGELEDALAWTSGFNTNKWIDGRRMSEVLVAYCDRTHRFEMAGGGSKTVPELRPFTLDAFIRVPDAP